MERIRATPPLATLSIDPREPLFERTARLSDYFLDQMFSLADGAVVPDVRR